MLAGKVALVTGANMGIGLETAAALAATGATTILACRDATKGAAARDEVANRSGTQDVHIVRLDLADLDSVTAAAAEVTARWPHLHILVNNAGGMRSRRATTKQGFEETFGVNHLGHFLLTRLLLAQLTAGAPSRIVNVASIGHRTARQGMHWDDLQFERRPYSGTKAYGESKLATILFTRELARRLAGTGVSAYACHPGQVRTGFGAAGEAAGVMRAVNQVMRPFRVSAAAGARTPVWLATAPGLESGSGGYYTRCRPSRPSRCACDDAAAALLWRTSEELLTTVGADLS